MKHEIDRSINNGRNHKGAENTQTAGRNGEFRQARRNEAKFIEIILDSKLIYRQYFKKPTEALPDEKTISIDDEEEEEERTN